MRGDHQEELLRYYWRELTYLRKAGASFAAQYPQVAAGLEIGAGGSSSDPHVERLIESFAFLTGRIQHNLDADFPEVASELLNLLYPHYLNPVPSMAIARFEVDHERGKLTTGHLLPKHTPLFAQSGEGRVCRFRTCYPVTLWPLAVTYAGFESTAQFDFLDRDAKVATVLRLRIEGRAGSLSDLELDRLRFHLHGDPMLVNTLYELLFCHVEVDPEGRQPRIAILPEGSGKPVFLPPGALTPVGFGTDEEVLPYPPPAHPGYRLLQEYFTFPEKFHFFDLGSLAGHRSTRSFDILFLLDQSPRDRLYIGGDTFLLGCTPVVNLFPRTTEPIRLDQRRTEYPLVADARRERETEIHSIREVSAAADPRDRSRVFAPFYSYSHGMGEERQRTFWHARRMPTGRADLPGTQMVLSLLDLDWHPRLPAVETLYAHTLCTNRDFAEQLPAGALLQTDVAAPLARISCLGKPSQEIIPPTGGANLWRLVSHLSLNHLSLASGKESLEALREILRLYSATGDAAAERQIAGLAEMSCRKVVRRTGTEAWRGFCRGNEVTLTFDEDAYVGSSAFLLASVLDRFLALYAAMNSFTQLVIHSRQRHGVWKQWPPRVGEQILL
ncbi:MAG TPA: type VI secretion system baseplate subunit TssF [Thermoanaerobaculia bacterium]|nr:type VI secretion system baseplate subunit TssF [Thermoanaerobaculia bacterium]